MPSRDILTKKEIKEQEKENRWVAEKIINSKLDKKGNLLFLVKWQGWGLKDATWQTADDLAGAKDILNDYLESITEN